MSKTILEKALLEAEQLEEAMKSNAKEILASTMKEEINELVKESLSENDYLGEQGEEQEVEIDFEDEGEVSPELELDLELDMEDETEDEMSDELAPLDLTGASDDEVLKIFKAMGDEDGIIIQKDDEEIGLVDTNTNTEYIIKLDESEEGMEEEMGDMDMDEDMYEDMDEDMDMDEMVYEITLDEEEDEDEDVVEETEGEEEETEPAEEVDEASRTLGMGDETKGGLPKLRGSKPNYVKESRPKRKQLGESRIRKSYNLLKEEVESLKIKNGEYKKALVTFKDKLNEVSVFNSNLAYVTRLFTEHSTTKQEKINVLKRFDGVETLKESKTLYKVIKDEMGKEIKMSEKASTISESVEKKIIKSSTQTKTSGGKLLESKVYENPQFSRMKDLMSKL